MKYLVFFLLISCNSTNKLPLGSYKTQKSSKIEKIYNYIFDKCNIIGVSLELKKDSTFNIETCSTRGNGKWHVKKDTLFLTYLNNRIYVDSLNDFSKIENIDITKKSEYFLIKNKNLIQFNETVDNICVTKLSLQLK